MLQVFLIGYFLSFGLIVDQLYQILSINFIYSKMSQKAPLFPWARTFTLID